MCVCVRVCVSVWGGGGYIWSLVSFNQHSVGFYALCMFEMYDIGVQVLTIFLSKSPDGDERGEG